MATSANATLLSAVNQTLLPPIITEPIFKKASETSALMQLARRVPLAVNRNTAIPVPMDVPTAGWVNEGGIKPTGSESIGIKMMTGKKVALLLPVSEEVVMTNPAGLYDQLVQDLPTAISRSFDYAGIHGLDLKTGAAGPFSDYLAKTPFSQTIGATPQSAGGVYADLVKGVQQVVNGPVQGYEFSGFAADPRLMPELMLATDTVGRPLMAGQDTNALTVGGGGLAANLIGYPARFNTGVSGKYYRSGDAVQVVTVNGAPTGGTFTVTVGGQTTGPLAYNASAATVQTAIQGLGTAAAANATVTGTGPYTVTFGYGSGPISTSSALTGGTTPSVSVSQTPNQDSGLRAIGGDYSQCAWGQAMDISIQISREASYIDSAGIWHSAFQENLVLLLVEAYYGFVVGDTNAFCAYVHVSGS